MSVPKQSLLLSSSSSQKRKNQSLGSARNRASSSSLKKVNTPSIEECIFCNKRNLQPKKNHFPSMINKALYSKYSSSQNYYFTKDINEILTGSRTPIVVKYKDTLTIDEEEDYLKRFYKANEYDCKIRMLTEYYKFHKDISRLFMVPTTNILNKYHDKKRRLEYIRVTKMLHEESESKSPSPKPKEKPRVEEKSPAITDRILDNLEITNTYYEKFNEQMNSHKIVEPSVGINNLKPQVVNKNAPPKQSVNGLNLHKVTTTNNQGLTNSGLANYGNSGSAKNKKSYQNQQNRGDYVDRSNNQSISNTIQDLNWKLGEIISNNSRNYGNYLDLNAGGTNNPATINEPFLNETISNLDNFLNFLQKNPQQQKMNDIPEIIAPTSNFLQYRHSNTLADPQIKQLNLHQISSDPKTYRGNEIEAPTLTQQLAYHSKTNSQSETQNLVSSATNLARKSYTTTTGTVQHENYVKINNYNNTQALPYKENKLNTDRPKSSAGLEKGQTKSRSNIATKIKNFEEVLKHNDQNTGFKNPPSLTSQRSVSRESKKTLGSSQNFNYLGKNTIFKTPRGIESLSRQRVNVDTISIKTGTLTNSASILNVKQTDSATRSNLGSTQSSLKSAAKVEYIPGLVNHTPIQNNFLNTESMTDRGLNTGIDIQGDQAQKKSHNRINSGNTVIPVSNGVKLQPALASSTFKVSLPLSSQNFLGASSSKTNLNSNLQANPQTLRDLKSRATYYEQRRQPSSLTGSLTKRDLQQSGQYNEMNKMLTQNNSKVGSTDVSNQNYGEAAIAEGLNSARPITTIHKYTKSESKYNKMESQKGAEIVFKTEDPPLSQRRIHQENASGATMSKSKYGSTAPRGGGSPNKQIYTYSQNNILHIFLNPNNEAPKDHMSIKTETDRFGTSKGNLAIGQQDDALSTKMPSKKLASPQEFQFGNNPLKSYRPGSGATTKRTHSNYSPLKSSKKEILISSPKLHQTSGYTGMNLTATNFINKHSKK